MRNGDRVLGRLPELKQRSLLDERMPVQQVHVIRYLEF
jgi:hypothetical protein